MTTLVTLTAVVMTLLGLVYLTITDPKRRRAFKLGPRDRGFAIPAYCLVFGPGPALLIAGEGAAFVIWFGVVTVAGWLLAARTPAATRRWPIGQGRPR